MQGVQPIYSAREGRQGLREPRLLHQPQPVAAVLRDTAAAKAEAQVLISEVHMEVEAYDLSVAAAEMARMYDGSDPYALAVSKALSAQKADSCRYFKVVRVEGVKDKF